MGTMSTQLLLAVFLFSLLGVNVTALNESGQQRAARPEPTLDARISAPDRTRYRAVRDSHDWRNPFLFASATGLELTSISIPQPRFVAMTDLRRVLADLPITDWPYGRVAVLQSPSIVPGDQQWIRALQLNIERARTILGALSVDEWGWPG
jgi:hypothetical protein